MVVISLVLVFTFIVGFQPTVLAATNAPLSEAEMKAIINETPFYDPSSIQSSCTDTTGNIAAGVNLPADILKLLNANKATYVAVGQAKNIPWQLLAALHYRETNLDASSNPAGGDGPYQIVSGKYPPGPITPAQFKTETEEAADFFLSKESSNLPNHQKKLSLDYTDADTIKDTFFSYNGRAQIYGTQAAQYGFSSSTQPYEGSPYVMNKFDAKRQSMGIITHDHGGVDGQDQRYGAFTIYAALAGVASTGNGCTGGAAAGSIVAVALAELSKNVIEVPDGSNSGPDIDQYTDHHPEPWCADFVSWVYMKAGKSFTGGSSGGWRIGFVPTLREWFQKNGTYTLRSENKFPPEPGDLIVLAGDATATDSSGAEGHTGIVYQVSGTTVVTIEGNTSNKIAKRTYNNYSTNQQVTGWGKK